MSSHSCSQLTNCFKLHFNRLWDHLASSMDLYVEPPAKSSANEVPRPKSPVAEPDTRNNSHNLESDSERGKTEKLSSRRRNREWRGIANEETRVIPKSEVSRVKHSSPEQVPNHRKRSRPDDQGTEVHDLTFLILY